MNVLLHIGQGLGLALAAGLRPFAPALLMGGLASAGVTFHLAHSDYGFLGSTPFLAIVAAALVLAYVAQRALGPERLENGPLGATIAGIGIGIGAVLFAGALASHHDSAWPGLLGGAAAALLTQASARPILARARARLEQRSEREGVALIADLATAVVAALAVFAAPLSYLLLLVEARLLLRGRRRAGEKYAGLRILR
jgi:hypothetical protein